MTMILVRNPSRFAGVAPGGGGGSGQPFPLPAVSEFYNSTQFEMSGSLPVNTQIAWMEDWSNGWSARANGEGWRSQPGTGTAWVTATVYAATVTVTNGGSRYFCIVGHTSGASTEPGVGGSWTTVWTLVSTRLFTGGPYDAGNIDDTRGMSVSIYSGLIPATSSEWTPLGMDGIGVVDIGSAGRGTTWAHALGVLAGGDQYSNYIFQHRLANSSGVAAGFNAVTFSCDIYIPSDYEFGAQKMLTPIPSGYDSGIQYGNLHMNLGAGGTSTTGTLAWQGAGSNLTANSLATITRGRWWNFAYRITLNVGGTGSLRIYATDLGTDGLSVPSGGTPTNVYTNTSYTFTPLDGTSDDIALQWIDWWANPVSTAAAPGPLITNCVAYNADVLPLIREVPV